MSSAYTAKTVVPKILIGLVGSNLSIYAVAAGIDVTNVLGGGIQALIEAPFKVPPNGWTFNVSGGGAGAASGLGLAALVAGGVGGGIWAWAAVATGGGGALIMFLITFVFLPALLIVIAILATLVARQALIIFVVFSAPIAFALYCLPNTEQYFRKWLKLAAVTLGVYPFIAGAFALANVAGVELLDTTSGVNKFVATLMEIVLWIVVLGLVPASFKILGGALDKFLQTATGWGKRLHQGVKGNPNLPDSFGNRTKRNLFAANTRVHQGIVDRGEATNAGRTRRFMGAVAGRFGNPDARSARLNAEEAERAELMSKTGRDNLRYAGGGYRMGAGQLREGLEMVGAGGLIYKRNADGTQGALIEGRNLSREQYFDARGRLISRQRYARGKRLYGSNRSAVGSQLEYTVRKDQGADMQANVRYAFAQNAMAGNWNNPEMADTWAQATFGHKDKWLSQWYSMPVGYTDAATGARGVRFQDVNERNAAGQYTNDANVAFDSMMREDFHTKQQFQLSGLRGEDIQAMNDRLVATQNNIDAILGGGPGDLEAESRRLAWISEGMDAMTQQMAAAGPVDPAAPGGGVSVSGPTPEVQTALKAMLANRRYRSAPTTTGGVQSLTNRDIVDATGHTVVGNVPVAPDRRMLSENNVVLAA